MSAGAVLVIASVCLLMFNLSEARKGGAAAAEMLPQIKEVIDAGQIRTPHVKEPLPDSQPQKQNSVHHFTSEMTEVQIDGNSYIGYLAVPSLGLELPVMSGWDYPSLQIAPCRQYGSTKTNDLVIAAHNYDSHFGRLKTLTAGSLIQFVDMDGNVSIYTAETVEIISPFDTDLVQNSKYDLILYTCTYGGKNRVMVGAKRIPDNDIKAYLASPQ